MPDPGRALARDDPEGFAVPFLPDRGHVTLCHCAGIDRLGGNCIPAADPPHRHFPSWRYRPADRFLRSGQRITSVDRFDPYVTPLRNVRYLRSPDGWCRRQADIRIEAVDVEVSGKGAAQGTRASQPPRQSEHLNIVESPQRAGNLMCLVLRGEI
jgi:hypothetical protein